MDKGEGYGVQGVAWSGASRGNYFKVLGFPANVFRFNLTE